MQKNTRSTSQGCACWCSGLAVASLTALALAGGPAPSQARQPGAATGTVLAATLDVRALELMERAIDEAIADGRIPGAVLWVEHEGVAFHSVRGHRSLSPARERMTRGTIFDISSLTKVVATTPAVMKLIEQGKLRLTDPVKRYIPEFKGGGKDAITIQQLLTHTSGLRPGLGGSPSWSGRGTAIELASAERTRRTPGTGFRYSDINFILLAEVVRRVSGQPLEAFVQAAIYQPLNMRDTGFTPAAEARQRIAPSGPAAGTAHRGTVQDPTARRMGGVAGHAGLFSTADDLAAYCRMLLNGGELDGTRVLDPATVRLMTAVHTPAAIAERRGLGWDIDSDYSGPRGRYFPIGSFGHTGYTGTSLWIDPFSRTFWILLSNRLHPDGAGNVLSLRAELGDLAALSVKGFDFTAVAGALPPRSRARPGNPERTAEVLNGIDVLERDGYAALRGLRIGLITNQTGRDRNGVPTIDLLHQADGVALVALFSPEHGIRGEVDAYVDDAVDGKTGLPIYSLYGKRRSPSPEQLAGLDALVFDIQDIGTRFYTYISTMGYAMEAAARSKLKFIVLDRVNPITGSSAEGPVSSAPQDFVNWHAMAVRHGMTAGELARMFNEEKGIGAALEVIPLQGWRRDMWLDETTIPWVNTSPNIRSLTQATLYPGVGLLETTNLSVGRGTDTPFEVFGAPYIDGVRLAERMNAFGLLGVRFDAAVFTPVSSKFAGQRCEGVRITLIDREAADVINIGIAGALALQELYAQKSALDRFGILLKDPATLAAIQDDRPLPEVRKLWGPRLAQFETSREKYLLYPPVDRFPARASRPVQPAGLRVGDPPARTSLEQSGRLARRFTR